MRTTVFEAIAWFFARMIMLSNWVYQVNLKTIGGVGYALMKLVDKERCNQIELLQQQMDDQEGDGSQSQLELQQLELQLLTSCQQLRDHAKENGGWEPQHEIALEAVGNCLIDEMNWDEESVHLYMKGIVESLDGYEYGP